MLVVVKKINEELKEDGSPKSLEWEVVSADGKEGKVKLYPQVKIGDEWLHLEGRWEELRNARDKTYDIERANIKVAKGYWKPVTKATEVKDVFKKEALREVQIIAQDDRQVSIECQVALKEIGENWRAGKFKDDDKEVEIYRLWIIDRLNKAIYGGADEKQGHKEAQSDKEAEVSQEVPTDEVGQQTVKKPATPTTLAELLRWALNHGRSFTPSWIEKQIGIPRTTMSNPEVIQDVYNQLKALMDWE